MDLKTIVIKLDVCEVQEILRIDMDEDVQGAFNFIRQNLAKRVKDGLKPHCVPVFEANYAPRVKE